MIFGQITGGVIPGGVASATPILIPAQPFPVVLRSLFFSVSTEISEVWSGVLEWLDGESNVISSVFSAGTTGRSPSFHAFAIGGWRPSGGNSAILSPGDPANADHNTWALPSLPVVPGERIRLRCLAGDPGDLTLSSIRYRFERVSFRRD